VILTTGSCWRLPLHGALIIQLLSPRKASNKKTLAILQHGCTGSGQGALILDALRRIGKEAMFYLLGILPDQAFGVAGQVFGDGGFTW